MTLLSLILTLDGATPLSQFLHPFERYDLDMDLEAIGKKAPWSDILAWETASDVEAWVGA